LHLAFEAPNTISDPLETKPRVNNTDPSVNDTEVTSSTETPNINNTELMPDKEVPKPTFNYFDLPLRPETDLDNWVYTPDDGLPFSILSPIRSLFLLERPVPVRVDYTPIDNRFFAFLETIEFNPNQPNTFRPKVKHTVTPSTTETKKIEHVTPESKKIKKESKKMAEEESKKIKKESKKMAEDAKKLAAKNAKFAAKLAKKAETATKWAKKRIELAVQRHYAKFVKEIIADAKKLQFNPKSTYKDNDKPAKAPKPNGYRNPKHNTKVQAKTSRARTTRKSEITWNDGFAAVLITVGVSVIEEDYFTGWLLICLGGLVLVISHDGDVPKK